MKRSVAIATITGIRWDDDGAGAGGPERPSGRPNWGTRQKFDDVVGKKIILHLLTTSIHVANTLHR